MPQLVTTQPASASAGDRRAGDQLVGERLAGFDLLRVGSALAVVILHATAPYLVHRMPGLTWPVFDQPSRIADAVGWGIELSIMPLFLMIAGLFALPLWRRHGDRGFLEHRAARLLGPLAFAAVLILPMDLYVWLLGWVIEGLIEPRKMRSLKFEAGVDEGLWGLSHLWFLHYLFFYCVAAVAAARAARWLGSGRKLGPSPLPSPSRFAARRGRGSMRSRFATDFPVFRQSRGWERFPRRTAALAGIVAGLALLGWATLAAVPEVVFGFQHAFLPVPSKWIYCGTYFAGGLLLAAEPRFLEWTRRWCLPLTFGGLAATAVGVWLGYGLLEGRGGVSLRLLATAVTVFTAWTLSLGLVGWASRTTTTGPRRIGGPSWLGGPSWFGGRHLRYAAAASFWVYLIHHPLVGLVHIDLKVYAPQLAPELKVVIATAVAVLLSGLSFEVLVRRSPVARWLGTPSEFRKGLEVAGAAEATKATKASTLSLSGGLPDHLAKPAA